MLGIDWAHTRDFAVYDGEEARFMPWQEVIKLASKHDRVVIEHGAPLVYLYRLVKLVPTYTVLTNRVAAKREELALEKDDLLDAQIIYEFGLYDDGLMPVTLDDKGIRLVYLYHQYLYSLKGQNAMGNLVKAMKRHFGENDNPTLFLMSMQEDEFEQRCESLKEEIVKLAPNPPPSVLKIKGMSRWLWAGIIVCADSRLFTSKSAYRKWCGLVARKAISYKFNRNAARAYWLCADQFIKQNTPGWREIYDRAKEELSKRQGYTHPHGGAMNRLATAFANYVYDKVKEEGISEQRTLW